MNQSGNKSPFSPKTVRMLAIGWIVFIAIAGAVTFAVLFITLNNRAERLAGLGATPAPSVTPPSIPTFTPPPSSPMPEGQSVDGGDDSTGLNLTPTPTYPPPETVGLQDSLELGGQVPGFIQHPQLMHNAGMSWVKFQIKWNENSHVSEAETLINSAHDKGFKVLLSISGETYPQSTINYDAYISYIGEVSQRNPDAIEIWNEMNLDREWPPGEISGSSYVDNMLEPAYNVIKIFSPETSVIIGALAPTGAFGGGCGQIGETVGCDDSAYIAQMYAAGAANYADCIGVHHNSGTTSPSARTGHVANSDHYSWYYLPTIEVARNGMNGELPVCITEFGYLTPDGFDTPIHQNFQWGNANSIEEHATWLAEGVDLAQQLGYIPLLIVWNVDFTNWDTDPYAGYAILRPNGTCPACDRLQQAISN